jgi:dTMP kinase
MTQLNTEKLKGKFIVLDGPDGCGKTTQTELLAQYLSENSLTADSFRDPGTTAIGEKIREILLATDHKKMTTTTEVLLYMAARLQLWTENIHPALAENHTVLLDRWLSSTCAYQGAAGRFGIDNVIKIAEKCLQKPWPDLTIILDCDTETAGSRMKRDLDRMERKGPEYHRAVRDGFLELARIKDFPVVDAAADIETVHENVLKILSETEL